MDIIAARWVICDVALSGASLVDNESPKLAVINPIVTSFFRIP